MKIFLTYSLQQKVVHRYPRKMCIVELKASKLVRQLTSIPLAMDAPNVVLHFHSCPFPENKYIPGISAKNQIHVSYRQVI